MLGLLSQSNANPQDLADTVVRIIETPAGQRQLRYRVSAAGGLGVDEINSVCEHAQKEMLQAFGLADLTQFVVPQQFKTA